MMGILGLVLGIIGLLASLIGVIWPIGNLITIIGLVLALAGIVLSVLEMKKTEKHGKATAGLVLGIIAAVISIIMLIACGGTKSAIGTAFNDITSNYTAEELANMSDEEQESVANDMVNNLADVLGVDIEEGEAEAEQD